MTLKFFTDCFLGIKHSEHENPLGFMTPNGTDKAAEKRKETVRDWARGWQKNPEVEFREFKNEPLDGYRIVDSVSRWSTSNKWFRVIDPRGFQLEISADNVVKILSNSTVINGEIQGYCIWARDGGTNVLVPVGSPEYVEAHENTVRSTQTAKANSGDFIKTQNGEEYRYLGEMYALIEMHKDYELVIRKLHVLQRIFPDRDDYISIDAFVKNPVAEIVKSDPLTREDAVKLAKSVRWSGTNLRGSIKGYFDKPTKLNELTEKLVELPINSIEATEFTVVSYYGQAYLMYSSNRTRTRVFQRPYAGILNFDFTVDVDTTRYSRFDAEFKEFNDKPQALWVIYLKNTAGEEVRYSYVGEESDDE